MYDSIALTEQSSKRYSTKSIAVRTWSIRQNAQPASSAEKLKHAVARFTNMNVGVTGKGGAI